MPAAIKVHIFKFLTPFVIFLIASFVTMACNQNLVYGGSGLVSSIGGATFIQGAKQFWVTSSTPTFTGITTAGAAVSGTVGSQTLGATADSSGNWSWTPSESLSGDNAVAITSESLTVSFTLTIGALPANIASSSAGSLAPAGSNIATLALVATGTLLAAFGVIGLTKTRKVQDL